MSNKLTLRMCKALDGMDGIPEDHRIMMFAKQFGVSLFNAEKLFTRWRSEKKDLHDAECSAKVASYE